MDKKKGHYHPLTVVTRDILKIFGDMGFDIAIGPEVETEHYNFDALNIPKDHPARDLWDTIWLKPEEKGNLLRTHTSPVQIRQMEENKPPFAIVAPGKTFRYEATDATHEAVFHQLEALMIGKDISLANLKGVFEKFFQEFFGEEIKIRFRPSYFPFVEPGVEVDGSCFKCSGKDKKCSLCRGSGWIELAGSGTVHPNVLRMLNIDHREWQGFAFGMGIERLAMFKYGVDDIRRFLSGDLRLTNQF
jgi:phenylalanyl-tRNA synthetase alpha chain